MSNFSIDIVADLFYINKKKEYVKKYQVFNKKEAFLDASRNI